ncbi:MAG TPA: peptidylprolyl isomerase [Acetobacteraceae bacterium]|nr:peptidylprolyl isomerase [Acetobacteraceae bacterium]
MSWNFPLRPATTGTLLTMLVALTAPAMGGQPDTAPLPPGIIRGNADPSPGSPAPDAGALGLGSNLSGSGAMPGAGPDGDNPLLRNQFYRPGDALHDAKDPIVATIEGRDVHLSSVGDAFRELPEAQQKQPSDLLYATLLDGLINQSALVLEAQRQHLDDDPDTRRHMVRAMELALVSDLLSKTIAARVTEQSLRARYQQRYAGQTGVDEAHLRVIAVKTRDEARQVVAELAKGADFATLAKQRSIDPSGVNGGDIGFVQRQQLLFPIAEATSRLAVGAVTPEPLPNNDTWDIFRLEARRTAPVPTFEQARAALRQELTQEVIRDEALKARSQMQVRALNLDNTPFTPPEQGLLDVPFNFSVKTRSSQ